MKEMTALMQLIEQLKKLSPNPGDGGVAKAYHEGLQWAIYKATSLLPVEKQQIVDAFNEGYREGEIDGVDNGRKLPLDVSDYDNAKQYYNDKFTQK